MTDPNDPLDPFNPQSESGGSPDGLGSEAAGNAVDGATSPSIFDELAKDGFDFTATEAPSPEPPVSEPPVATPVSAAPESAPSTKSLSDELDALGFKGAPVKSLSDQLDETGFKGEPLPVVAKVADAPKLENETRAQTYLGQSKSDFGDTTKIAYERELGRETGNAWSAFGNQMLSIISLGSAKAVREDRETSDILGDKYPRTVADPTGQRPVMGTPGGVGTNLKIETFKLSEQPVDVIALQAERAGIAAAKIAQARRDAGDDPQTFYANIRQLAAGEVAKRAAVKARAEKALQERGTTKGGYVAEALVPNISYTAGYMLYGMGGPVGLTALLTKTSLESADKFATDRYAVSDDGQIYRTKTGAEAGEALGKGAIRGAVSMGAEMAGGEVLNLGLKTLARPFITKAATEAIARVGIVRYATRNWKPGISQKMVNNTVNVAEAAHFNGAHGEWFEELVDPVASSFLGVSDTYSDRPKVEAFKAEMRDFWNVPAQGQLVVGLLGLQALGALAGLPVTMKNSVRDKSLRLAVHNELTTAGVDKKDADRIVASDQWMDTLQGISGLSEEKAQTILAGLSDKNAAVVTQVNNSFAAQKDAKNFAPDFDEAALGAATAAGDHRLGNHLIVSVVDTTDKVLDADGQPLGGATATLRDNETGIALGEFDVSTPEGRAALAKDAGEASQFRQAVAAQRDQKAKFIKEAVTRLGVGTDVYLGGSREDVARELEAIGYGERGVDENGNRRANYASMFRSGQTPGMTIGGTVFIALDAVQSAEAATSLVMHETGVHEAVDRAFKDVKGVVQEQAMVDAVIAAIGRKEAMSLAAGELTRRYRAEARLNPEGEARDAALAAVPGRVRKALENNDTHALWLGLHETLASVAEKGVYTEPAKRSKLETAVMNTFSKDEAVNERIRNFVAAKQETAKGDIRFFGYGGNTYDANGTFEPDPNATTPAPEPQEEPNTPVQPVAESPAPEEGTPAAPADPAGGNTASVPVMITKQMEADLRGRGYTQDQINKLTPQEANDILAKPAAETPVPATPQEGAPKEFPIDTKTGEATGEVGDEIELETGVRARIEDRKGRKAWVIIRGKRWTTDYGKTYQDGWSVGDDVNPQELVDAGVSMESATGIALDPARPAKLVAITSGGVHILSQEGASTATPAPVADAFTPAELTEIDRVFGYSPEELATLDPAAVRKDLADARTEEAKSKQDLTPKPAEPVVEPTPAKSNDELLTEHLAANAQKPETVRIVESVAKEGANRVEGLTVTGDNRKLTAASRKIDNFIVRLGRKYGVSVERDGSRVWVDVPKRVRHSGQWIGAVAPNIAPATRVTVTQRGDGSFGVDEAELQMSEGRNRARVSDFLKAMDGESDGQSEYLFPLLTAIDSGELSVVPESPDAQKPEYDGIRNTPLPPALGKKLFREGSTGKLDTIIENELMPRGAVRSPDVGEFWTSLLAEVDKYDDWVRDGAKSGEQLVAAREQAEKAAAEAAAAKEAEDKAKNPDPAPKPDEVPPPATPVIPPAPPPDIRTAKQKMLDRMKATAAAKAEDSKKAKEPTAPPILDGGTPADIEADKKRIAAQKKAQAERDELVKRAAKTLTGGMGDTTPPLFPDVEDDLALFNQPTAAPDPDAARKAKLKAFLDAGRKGVLPNSDGLYKLVTDAEKHLTNMGITTVWGEVQYDDDSDKSLHAVKNGKTVGFIDLYPLPTGEYGVGQLTVKKGYQRKGVATALFDIAQKSVPNLVLHSYDYTADGVAWVNSLQESGRYKLVTDAEEIKYLRFRSNLRKFFLDNWAEYYEGAADIMVSLSEEGSEDAEYLIRFATEEFDDDAHPTFDAVILDADLQGDMDDWMRALDLDFAEASKYLDEKTAAEYGDEITRLEAEQKAAEEAAKREAKKAEVESGTDVTRRKQGAANVTDPRLRKGVKFLLGEKMILDDGTEFAMPAGTQIVVTGEDGKETLAPFDGFGEGMTPTVWVVSIDTTPENAENIIVYGWGTTEDDAAEMSRNRMRVANKLVAGEKRAELLFPPRVGVTDPRAAADISQTDIKATFGLADKVNFGASIPEAGALAERQTWVNGLHESFADLADVLGIPRAAIGFGGGFHMVVGVTGKGSANAHYIPDTGVVNLTRKNGAGALAHEWWHHLQDWLKKTLAMDNSQMFPKSSALMFPDNRGTPVSDAYRNLFTALDTATALTTEADARDKAIAMKPGVRTQMLADGYTEAEVQSAFNGDSTPQKNTPGTAMFRAYAAYANYTAANGAIAINAFNLASRDADHGKAKYWMTSHEKMARVLQNLTALALAQRGTVNSVLTNYDFGDDDTAYALSPSGVVALSKRFDEFTAALSAEWTAALPRFDATPVPANRTGTAENTGVTAATAAGGRKVIKPQKNMAVEKEAGDLLRQAAGLINAETKAKERDRKYAAALRKDGDIGLYKLEDEENETRRDLWRELSDITIPAKVRVNRAIELMIENVRTKYQLARTLDGTGMEAYAYAIERVLKDRSPYYDDDGYFGPMFDRLRAVTMKATVTKQMLADGYTAEEVKASFAGTIEPKKATPGTGMFRDYLRKLPSKTDAEEHGLYVGIDGEVTAHTEKIPPALRKPLETAQAAWKANHPGMTAREYLLAKLDITPEEMDDKLSIGQQDTVTFALSAADAGEKGFLVAHQAGFGKGRVLTAIMRGLDNTKKDSGLIFLTERPDLWGDIGRDAAALGVVKKMFATDQEAETISFTEDELREDGTVVERTLFSTPAHGESAEKLSVKASNRLIADAPFGDSIIMSTYTQLAAKDAATYFKALDAGETLPSPASNKYAAVLAYAQRGDVTVIADESHNAVGDDSQSNRMLTHLVSVAKFTVFSSGTAATNLDSLVFYTPYLKGAELYEQRGVFHSALRGLGIDMVGEVVKSIVEHGSMLRFEAYTPDVQMFDQAVHGDKTMMDAEVTAAENKRSLQVADGLNGAAHALDVLQNTVGAAFEVTKADRDDRPGGEVVGMSSAMASRSAYNNIAGLSKGLTEQGWLASKIDQIVRQVVYDVDHGIAPSLGLFNTNNSLLADLETGDDVSAISVLRSKAKAAIEKMFVITREANSEGVMADDTLGKVTYDLRKWADIDRLNNRFGGKFIKMTAPKTGNPKPQYTKLLSANTADDMQAAYEYVTAAVDRHFTELEAVNFTMSPIDTLREKIENFYTGNGVGPGARPKITVVEATGRPYRVVNGKKVAYDNTEIRRGRRVRRVTAAFADYNSKADGRVVMIYNTAANSGVSGHLKKDSPNQARRRTYFLQIPPNPAEYEQMIFRFSRKNQVEKIGDRNMLPEVFFFPSPVPAEKRMMEKSKQKIDALSAVTSGAKSARLAVGENNMVDEYGDLSAYALANGVYANTMRSYGFTLTNIPKTPGEYLMEFLLRVQSMPTDMQGEILAELDSTVDNMKEQAIADGVYHGAVDKVIADKVKPSLITDRGYMVAMVTTMATRTLEDVAVSARKEWMRNRGAAAATLNDAMSKVMDKNTNTVPLARAVYQVLSSMAGKLNLTGDGDTGNVLIYGSNRVFVTDFRRDAGSNVLSLDGYLIDAYAPNGRRLSVRLSRLVLLQRDPDGKINGDFTFATRIDQATTPFFNRWGNDFSDLTQRERKRRLTNTGADIVRDVVDNDNAAARDRYVSESKHYIIAKTIRELGLGLGELIIPNRQLAVVAIDVGSDTLYGVNIGTYSDILPDTSTLTVTDFERTPLTSGDTHNEVTPQGMRFEIGTDGVQKLVNVYRSGDKASAEAFGKRAKVIAADGGRKGAAPLMDDMNAALGGKIDYRTRYAARPERATAGETITEEDLSTQFSQTSPSPDVEEFVLAQNPGIAALIVGELKTGADNFGVFDGGKWVAKTLGELEGMIAENINIPFVVFQKGRAVAEFMRVGNDKGELQPVTRDYAERLAKGAGAVAGEGKIAKYDKRVVGEAARLLTDSFGIRKFTGVDFKTGGTRYLTGTDQYVWGTKRPRSAKHSYNREGGMFGIAESQTGTGATHLSASSYKFEWTSPSRLPRIIAANLLLLSGDADGQRLSDILKPMASALKPDVKRDAVNLLRQALNEADALPKPGHEEEAMGKPRGTAPQLAGGSFAFPVNKAATTEDYWEVLGATPTGNRIYLEARVSDGATEAYVTDKAADYVYIGQIAVMRRRGDKTTILDQAVIGPGADGFDLDMSIGAIEDHNNEIWANAADDGRFKLEDLDERDRQLLDAFTKGANHYANAGLAYGKEDDATVAGVTGGFRAATSAQRAAMGEEPYEAPDMGDHTHEALAEQAVKVLSRDPTRADTIAALVIANPTGPDSVLTDLDRAVLTLGRQMVNNKTAQAARRASASSATPAMAQSAMEAFRTLVARDSVLRQAQDLAGSAAGRALNAVKMAFTPALDLTYRIGAAERTKGAPLSEAEIAALRTEIDALKAQQTALENTIELLRKKQDGKTGTTGKTDPTPKPAPRITTLQVRSACARLHNAFGNMTPDEIFGKAAVELGVSVTAVARAFSAAGRFSLKGEMGGGSVRGNISDWWKLAEERAQALASEGDPETTAVTPDAGDDTEPLEGGNLALEAVKLAVDELGADATREDIVTRALDYVKDTSLAALSVNEFERAVIRYYDTAEGDVRTPEQVRLSELKTELLWRQRYFDILNGVVPEKRGRPATPNTQEAREWHREFGAKFAEMLRDGKIPESEKNRQLASFNTRLRTTLENRMADLKKAIAAGELIPASERRNNKWSEENIALKAEVDSLKKLYDELDVVKEALDNNRVKKANDRLAYWETRRADAENGIFKGKKPEQPVSDRLREIRDRIAAVQTEVQRLKSEDPAQIATRVAEYAARVYTEIDAIDARIEAGAAVRTEAAPQSAYQIASAREREALRLARIRERDAWRAQNAEVYEEEREQTRILTLNAQIDAAEARIAAKDYVRAVVRTKRPFNKEIYEKERKLRELKDRIAYEGEKLENKAAFVYRAASAMYKFVLASTDLSGTGMQAVDTLRTDLMFHGGVNAREILTEAWSSMKDPAEAARIVHELFQDPRFVEAAHLGLDVTRLFDEITGGNLAEYIAGKAPIAFKPAVAVINATQRHFLITSLLARWHEYVKLLNTAPEGFEYSEDEKRLLVSVANTATGAGDVRIIGLGSAKVGKALGTLLWAARLTASQVQRAFLLNGIIGFGAERGILLRPTRREGAINKPGAVSAEFKMAVLTQNLQQLASFIALNVALKLLLGALGWSKPEDDPNEEGWFDFLFDPPNIGGIELDVSGRVTTMRRSILKLIGIQKNTISSKSGNRSSSGVAGRFDTLNRMMTGRLRPDLALGLQTILGETAFREPFGPRAWEQDKLGEGLGNMGKSFVPMSIQQMSELRNDRGALTTAATVGLTILGMTTGAVATPDYRMNLHKTRLSLYKKETDPKNEARDPVKASQMREAWGADIARASRVAPVIAQANAAKKAKDTARYEALAAVVEEMLQ